MWGWCAGIALEPKRTNLEDDKWAEKEKERRRKEFERTVARRAAEIRRQRIKNGAIGLIGMVVALIVGWNAWGIFTAPPAPPKPEITNPYGFAKSDFPRNKQWEYPSSCFKDGHEYRWTSSLPRCRSQLDQWERSGTVWVTWEKDAPYDEEK